MVDFKYLIEDTTDKAQLLAYRLTVEKYKNKEIEEYEFVEEFSSLWVKLNTHKKFKDAETITKAIEKYGEPHNYGEMFEHMYTKDEIKAMSNVCGIVYIITNLVNGKKYIGKTSRTFNERYRGSGVGASRVYGHIKQNLTGNTHLFTSILKYGLESFKVNIVFHSDSDFKLHNKEKELIEKYKTNNQQYGYNKTIGGEGVVKTAEELFHHNKFLDGVNPQKIMKLINGGEITYEELMELTKREVVIIYRSSNGTERFYKYASINGLINGTKGSKKHGDYITKGEALYKLLNNHGYKIPKGKRNIDVVLLEDLNVPNGFKFYNDGGKYYVGEKPTKK